MPEVVAPAPEVVAPAPEVAPAPDAGGGGGLFSGLATGARIGQIYVEEVSDHRSLNTFQARAINLQYF